MIIDRKKLCKATVAILQGTEFASCTRHLVKGLGTHLTKGIRVNGYVCAVKNFP